MNYSQHEHKWVEDTSYKSETLYRMICSRCKHVIYTIKKQREKLR